MSPELNPSFSIALVQQFRELLSRFASLVKDEGLSFVPFQNESLPHFLGLSPTEQGVALEELAQVIRNFEEVLAGGHRLVDTPQLLWRSLRRLGYVWESDIFDKISPGDVVQVYSAEHRMVFWNLRLMEMVSFTIEQLFCTPWWLMGKRVPDVSQGLVKAIEAVLTGSIPGTFDPGIEDHVVCEQDTAEMQTFKIHIKHFSPLRRDSRIVGFMVINTADPI